MMEYGVFRFSLVWLIGRVSRAAELLIFKLLLVKAYWLYLVWKVNMEKVVVGKAKNEKSKRENILSKK